jgi:outer membrane protein OmpA-like peptidoglycan-associated protein
MSFARTGAVVGLTASLVCGLAAAALAQDTSTLNRQNRGFYIGGGLGANFQTDVDFRGSGTDSKATYDPGPVGLLSFGYAFGNGLRAELEGGYRYHDVDKINGAAAGGHTQVASAMVNAIYDFDLHTPVVPLTPHLGAGVGYAHAWDKSGPHNGLGVKGNDGNAAFQAIAGVEYAVTPGLKLGLDYRWFVAHDLDFKTAATGARSHAGDLESHSILATLRYEFGTPAPVAQPVAAPAPAPMAPPAPRQAAGPQVYTVYFDFNRADLAPSAVPVVDQAAANAKQNRTTRIQVVGHADRSGSDRYNQRLSERRASAVRAALVERGVSAGDIVTVGRGESEPAVPTPDGVREPRNRRVVIELQQPGV